MAHFVGVTRPGYELSMDARFPEGVVSLLEIPALTISSSDCRDRVEPRDADLVPRARHGRALRRQAPPVPGEVLTAELTQQLRALPKVELHLHLDGCMSYDAAASLEPGLTREVYEREFIAPAHLDGLPAFLARCGRHLALLQTPRALVTCISDLYEQLAATPSAMPRPVSPRTSTFGTAWSWRRSSPRWRTRWRR